MNIIKLVFISLILMPLMSCTKEAPVQSNTLLSTYEIGVNFTDHMLKLTKNDQDYMKQYMDGYHVEFSEFYTSLYTHELHYLLPQIVYYLPMDLNLESKDAWVDYFDHWIESLKTNNPELVHKYFDNTILKAYILETFDQETDYLGDLLELVKPLFVDQFQIYESEVWPDIAKELSERSKVINDSLASFEVHRLWEDLLVNKLDQDMIFTLTICDNEDLDYIRLSDHRLIVFANQRISTTEMLGLLSHYYGFKVMLDLNRGSLANLRETYGYLEDPYRVDEEVYKAFDFAVAHINSELLGFQTQHLLKYMNKGYSGNAYNQEENFIELFIDGYLKDLD